MKKKAGVKTETDYLLGARKVARWGMCAQFGSMLYHSALSDAEIRTLCDEVVKRIKKI